MPTTDDRQALALQALDRNFYPLRHRLHPIALAHHAQRLIEQRRIGIIGDLACEVHETAHWLLADPPELEDGDGPAMAFGDAFENVSIYEPSDPVPKVGKYRADTFMQAWRRLVWDWISWAEIYNAHQIPTVEALQRQFLAEVGPSNRREPFGVQYARRVVDSWEGMDPGAIYTAIAREGKKVADQLARLDSGREGAKFGRASKAIENANESSKSWRQVRRELLDLRAAGEPFTSRRKLAEHLGTTPPTISKAIDGKGSVERCPELQGWEKRHKPKARQGTKAAARLSAPIVENLAAPTKEDELDQLIREQAKDSRSNVVRSKV